MKQINTMLDLAALGFLIITPLCFISYLGSIVCTDKAFRNSVGLLILIGIIVGWSTSRLRRIK